ncbi:MAG: alpha/beta hydrolase [Candidatus Limnocylindria bacterium]
MASIGWGASHGIDWPDGHHGVRGERRRHPHWPAFARWFMSKVFSEPDSGETIREFVEIALDASPEILITQERETNWAAIPPLLKSVTIPTMLIHGDGDLTTPMSMVRALADAMPDARLEILPGGGHRPDIRTPARVNELIAAFLIRSPTDGASA